MAWDQTRAPRHAVLALYPLNSTTIIIFPYGSVGCDFYGGLELYCVPVVAGVMVRLTLILGQVTISS